MPDRNAKGPFTLSAAGSLRNLAVIGYLVEQDAALFRENLVEATQRHIELLDRFDSGDPIPAGLVSMLLYQKLLDALASGDVAVAKALGARMGSRATIEKKFDRPFDIAMGYSLKAVLACEDDLALAWLGDVSRACSNEKYRNFAGYVSALRGIVKGDFKTVEAAIEDVLAGHRRLSMGRGLFADSPDKFLSVWGLGIINLAVFRGLNVNVYDPLIPAPLFL